MECHAIIIAYSRKKFPDEVLNLYHQMILKGVRTDKDNLTFMVALKACTRLLDLKTGEEIWCRAMDCGFELHSLVGSSVLNLYAKASKWDDVASVRKNHGKDRDEESARAEFVLNSLDEEVKGKMLCNHSEWLAIAFGLLNTGPGTRLLIIKNLRVCGNCHEATKFITKIVNKEIVVRDLRQFHRFKKGICSCGDYW
uniref:DYW domain-containing protein n=1 Tax=Quercus lobata TaxID=97700 RepID=A0A7N2MJL1_QUELO